MDDLYKYERELISKGINLIAGVDEVGRGPLVGPVVTAAVILPINYKLDGTGYVYEQSIAAGSKFNNNDTINVKLKEKYID